MPKPTMLASLPMSDNLALAEIVKNGIPSTVMTELAEALNLTIGQISKAVLIPQRTLERRIASRKALKIDESERAVRLARLYTKAIAVFGNKSNAAAWFNHPIDSIGGRTPLDLCSTESSAREVEMLLGRIEHGVF